MKVKKLLLLAFSAITLMITLPGCQQSYTDTNVDKVIIKQGNNQCLRPGQESKEIIVELLSANKSGLFGGKGSRSPVPSQKVLFKYDQESGLKVTADNDVSDNGGNIKFKITTGKIIGDHYIKIFPEAKPKKSVTIRVINGIELTGKLQQTKCGNNMDDPISLTVVDGDNKPIEGAEVYFTLSASPEKRKKKEKAKLKPKKVLTDKDGKAETRLKLGKKTGFYVVTAEVVDKRHNLHIRQITIPEIGINYWALFFTVAGGLAIFILGMKLMSDGLQLVAGEKMRKILQWFTINRWTAVMAGALVTAVIQSSSACTVMVVGFVNAALLNLTQAIGIVFGANIGTTITAQMISFKLSGLALPAIVFGVILTFFAKKTTAKGWSQAILGFGLLFYGMGLMGGELKLVGDFPFFSDMFKQVDCTPGSDGIMPFGKVFLAIVIGTVMTVVIQSSSATIGIAIALASGGLINFYTAVPLILGDNIGTTITAALASMGANKRAKQTALAHFLFNAIGTTYMVILFYIPYNGQPAFLYLINYITPGNGFASENIARHIAMAHTFFNVFNVIVLIWFLKQIAALCNKVIKVEEEKVVHHLAPQLLNTPSVAIEQTIDSIRYMLKESWSMVKVSTEDIFLKGEVNEELVEELTRREVKIDELQENVTNYLVEITRRELSEPQAEIVPLLMHCTNDAERIADHTENIIGLTKRIKKAQGSLSEEAYQELREMWTLVCDEAKNILAYFDNIDSGHIEIALRDEKSINKLASKLEKAHIKRLKTGDCDPLCGVIFIEIVAELEKIGDHMTNIAERAPELQKHHLEIH